MRAEDDADFAEKIIILLSSLDYSKEMASNAKEIPGKYFSQAEFEKIVKEAIVKKYAADKRKWLIPYHTVFEKGE